MNRLNLAFFFWFLAIIFLTLLSGALTYNPDDEDINIFYDNEITPFLMTMREFNEPTISEWVKYKTKYGKRYNDKIDLIRMLLFCIVRFFHWEHNERKKNKLEYYTMQMNNFSDWIIEERRSMLGYRPLLHDSSLIPMISKNQHLSTLFINTKTNHPYSIDWRKKGFVTPVKDQGSDCASGWAFSATGALEGQFMRATGQLVSLSEQDLIDCSYSFKNVRCDGGVPILAFIYAEFNGISTAISYPYIGKSMRECRSDRKIAEGNVTGQIILPPGDEEALKIAVATIGPISVAIHVNKKFWSYKSGVFYERNCPNGVEYLNHAVLIVGYGHSKRGGIDYWLVKNSWGEDWGENGYIRMARNKDNHCGIANFATYPIVK